MYAHQVIESLSKYAHGERESPLIRTTMQAINNAQKFHAGLASEMLGFMEPTLGSTMFSSPMSRPPYPLLWVDFLGKRVDGFASKYGALVAEIGESKWLISSAEFTHTVVGFGYSWALSQWIMAPMLVGFTPGEDGTVVFGLDGAFRVSPEDKQEYAEQVSQLAGVAYASIMFLNCKGTRTEAIEAPIRLNRTREKNGKKPLFSYKKLIVPAAKNERERRDRVAAGESVRVHMCRGHFKEYTESAPLFGRLTGLFWCPPHVRGDKEKGMIHKDYVLKTA